MSKIQSSAEHLTLNADGSGNDIKFQSNGSEVASISDGGVLSSTGGSTHADNVKAKFGTGDDLQIWHDGTHTRLQNTTGNFNIRADVFNVTKSDDSEDVIVANADGDIKLYRNNVIHLETLASGVRVPVGGVLFGTDTAAANALNDYEEGSFTPVFTGSSGSTGSYNTGEHEARYTKIGRLVVIQFKLTLTHKGSWGGEVRFTGLPFSVSDTMPATGSVTLAYVDIPGDASNHNVYVTSGVTYWRVQYTTDNNTTSMVLLSETANNASFSGTFSYTTND